MTVASAVASGHADTGLGIEMGALQAPSVEFIPLKQERFDLVIRREDMIKPQFQMVLSTLRSPAFRRDLSGLGGYDLTDLGKVLAEV